MEVTVKRLDELHIPEKNIRRHTEKQIKEYVRSLEMFGQIKPIVADENGEIIAGNGLYMALKQMGRESCDCYILSGLSAKQKKKLMLADNRVYELGITDMDSFDEIIRELDGDIDVPGWEMDLLSMMNASFSEVDEAVNSYGAYDDADVAKLADHKPQPVQQTALETAPVATPEQNQEAAQVQKVIICPKCGERICL